MADNTRLREEYERMMEMDAIKRARDYLERHVNAQPYSQKPPKKPKNRLKPTPKGYPTHIFLFTKTDIKRAKSDRVKLALFMQKEPEVQNEEITIGDIKNLIMTTPPGTTTAKINTRIDYSGASEPTWTTGSDTTPVYTSTSADYGNSVQITSSSSAEPPITVKNEWLEDNKLEYNSPECIYKMAKKEQEYGQKNKSNRSA